jgi:uncharacterized protein YcbX
MCGEALPGADVSWHGLAGDRRWAFVRNDAAQSGFPWLTIRERNDMHRYRPSFVDADRPDKSRVSVRTPSGCDFDIADPALAAELGAGEVRAIKQDRGIFDTFPLSLISTRTIATLGASVGQNLDVRRFRPNLLIETVDDVAFAEDAWVGCVLRIGAMRLRIDKRDGRCVIITIDPETTLRDTTILRAVARDRQGCLGVYGTTVEPGRVAVDDYVWSE